jgi:hypothetical protein
MEFNSNVALYLLVCNHPDNYQHKRKLLLTKQEYFPSSGSSNHMASHLITNPISSITKKTVNRDRAIPTMGQYNSKRVNSCTADASTSMKTSSYPFKSGFSMQIHNDILNTYILRTNPAFRYHTHQYHSPALQNKIKNLSRASSYTKCAAASNHPYSRSLGLHTRRKVTIATWGHRVRCYHSKTIRKITDRDEPTMGIVSQHFETSTISDRDTTSCPAVVAPLSAASVIKVATCTSGAATASCMHHSITISSSIPW